ncbi:nucleotidyl transferase AbiEii/AbiGii toxin family protein [Candidatus Woesearchaeota archaeon]|nr:nucleotidyl transferase AbiEii/AbiGii toxin family protein [Candidatus Woesearchaeota archaeon]
MNPLEIRESEIFKILEKIKEEEFVLIGGYAVNTYTLPRFSVDCDIVVKKSPFLENINTKLVSAGYTKKEEGKSRTAYCGEFLRYEKTEKNTFKVSMDILIDAVTDRSSSAVFSADWIFEHSDLRLLRGKTIVEKVSLRIVNPDALIAMKTVACRNTDIRDIFMLIIQVNNFDWIQQEVQKRANFKKQAKVIREKVSSIAFKNNLQGVYGYVDEKIFEKHQKKILEFCKI